LGRIKSTESDVCYFEVDVVFNQEPVELLEESTWTAGLRRTGRYTHAQQFRRTEISLLAVVMCATLSRHNNNCRHFKKSLKGRIFRL